jgi:uncharacterized protein YndB with AHSA1/START domain
MEKENLEIKAAIQVLKSASEVFEAIVDPGKMSNYFISSSSGRIEAGKTLTWRFPEYDMNVPVKIVKVEKDKFISFNWNDADGKEMLVQINLEKNGDSKTKVVVTEGVRQNDAAGIKWLKGNTEGWANFLACLKAFLEYGINLRKGAFEPATNASTSV